jgi:glycosidase
MSVPDWCKDAIFYQIFPDRFWNGDRDNDPPNVRPWGSIPTTWGFQGGDLRGIIQKFDYLLDLGVNAIYLNPIFQSTSTHRYNTTNYYKIDPKLGSLDDFHQLIALAHRNQVRIILDGVFNHCGRGFFAFNDILENQENSAYRDWFHIKHFPVNAYSPGDATDYLGWWGMKSLPKFNTKNPSVRKFIMDIARYWIEQGADGWRLDVPSEINDDSFWEEFRHVVKS